MTVKEIVFTSCEYNEDIVKFLAFNTEVMKIRYDELTEAKVISLYDICKNIEKVLNIYVGVVDTSNKI